jgi:hypothetical protein
MYPGQTYLDDRQAEMQEDGKKDLPTCAWFQLVHGYHSQLKSFLFFICFQSTFV